MLTKKKYTILHTCKNRGLITRDLNLNKRRSGKYARTMRLILPRPKGATSGPKKKNKETKIHPFHSAGKIAKPTSTTYVTLFVTFSITFVFLHHFIYIFFLNFFRAHARESKFKDIFDVVSLGAFLPLVYSSLLFFLCKYLSLSSSIINFLQNPKYRRDYYRDFYSL